MTISRRQIMKWLAGALPLAGSAKVFGAGFPRDIGDTMSEEQKKTVEYIGAKRSLASGPYAPTWESLKQYQAPDWFRDAKFGIWAHWSAQCVPEQGDWYARQMYIQGHSQNKYHVEHYGPPSQFGFKEIDNLWKVDKWEPEELIQLYIKAGAKYFVSLANHHDNFDCYDSRHHEWNSVRVGPKKDIVGTWAQIARKHGLRFGVTNHSAHSWHWFQTAYGYDAEGPLAGVRYDGFLTKKDGQGKWWEGLDPQELYTGPNIVIPNGLTAIKAATDWHNQHDRKWTKEPPPNNPAFVDKWFLRCQDLIDRYDPDLLYFDNTELPLGQAGLDIAAHFYNSNIRRHHGRLEAVLNSKGLKPEHMGTMVLDIERGRANQILADPWQTDTCIGSWHYQRSLYEQHRYKTPEAVIKMLIDIVSKNGNLLLNIPVRGDGSIDEDEKQFLAGLASWMPANQEAIFGTRPFVVFGEGPPDVASTGNFNESKARPYTAEDIRFTTKGNVLYAFALGWPAEGKITIKTLARSAPSYSWEIAKIELLGAPGALHFTRDENGLVVMLPERKPNDYAYVFKITPKTLPAS
jgi:alpha-L-fucosidase